MNSDILNLKTEVFAKQKILAKIYAKHKERGLLEYIGSWQISKPIAESGGLFAQMQKLLLRVYPAELTSGALEQIGQNPLVSTIDHHGILNHPFFINSNLIYSQRAGLKYLICLSTAGVSLNNSSWPGCLLVTGQDGLIRRFSFFSDKIKNHAVLAAKSFKASDVKRLEFHIKIADFLTKDEKGRLLGLIQEIFRDPGLFEFNDFSGQAAYVSAALWQKIFPAAPKLLYLPLEELVNELIINEITPREGHILHKLFFTPSGWDIIEKYFQGSLGAFSAGHKGSFLFWGVDGKGRRIHLARQKDKLHHDDFTVSLSAKSVVSGLQTGKLYSTSLVCFLVLLYYNVTCLGGFNQVNWLTNIKEKFADLLTGIGEKDLAARILSVPTENFAEGSLAFGINRQGQIYKPALLDLFLREDKSLYEKYRQLASLETLGESIGAQLPEIYKVITPFSERNGGLSGVTEGDILNQNGLANKIKSVLGV